jgi:hypothetical protein
LVGVWKTTSAVLNGVEQIGGANLVDSEYYYFYAGGYIDTESFSDSNFATLYSSSYGTYTLPTTSTIVSISDVFSIDSQTPLLTDYPLTCDVLKINASELQIKFRDYPTPGANYVKKLVKTNVPLPL